MTGIEERLHQIMEKVEMLDRKISAFQLPANEQVIDDIDLQKEAKVSQRTTAMWRSAGLIKYTKVGGKVMYLKSWLIEAVEANAVKPTWEKVKLKRKKHSHESAVRRPS